MLNCRKFIWPHAIPTKPSSFPHRLQGSNIAISLHPRAESDAKGWQHHDKQLQTKTGSGSSLTTLIAVPEPPTVRL
jgi:hypothetical protein